MVFAMYYLFGLILGLLIGWNCQLPERMHRINDTVLQAGLAVLLLAMGMRIGADKVILQQLGNLGLKAVLLALAGVVGSIAAVQLVATHIMPESNASENP
jgi:hypothetical protein